MMQSVLALAGPSGSGKSTVAYELVKSEAFELVRSATTRERRRDGKSDEYIYLDREEFLSRIEAGEFLEYTEFSGNLYATPRGELSRIFAEGKTPLLILDMDGIERLRKSGEINLFAVYLYSALDVLDRRLERRGEVAGTPIEQTRQRMKRNREDYLSLPEKAWLFDSFIENSEGEVDGAVASVLDGFDGIRVKNNGRKIAEALAKSVEN